MAPAALRLRIALTLIVLAGLAGSLIAATPQTARAADTGATLVAVTDGRIAAIGRIAHAARQTLDCGGLALMPGIVDIHTHLFHTTGG